MEPRLEHRWDLTPAEAFALQRELAALVRPIGDPPPLPCLVAGCDAAGGGRGSRLGDEIVAGVVVLRIPGFEIVDCAHAAAQARFPYIPGLLGFREGPAYLEAFARLRARPDLLLCDGQGIAHPRGLGLAAHLGVLFDLPSAGVAKSRLIGEHRDPGAQRGCSARLVHQGRCVGRVVRTRTGVRPLFVSPGHRLTVEAAARVVLSLATRFRLPEPTRLADRWVARLRRDPCSRP
ncbi:MAG: endonuclease V [Candidatus Eisenbacteria bacterium]|uniref:Endonuclease V n=1 Tax=Eiseniibacteriota bacterium TaxID=2212470 RepID=A0A937X6G7_UNCEI|nr:endonuclease V [Candidatus Eisenbacteria bacterium]